MDQKTTSKTRLLNLMVLRAWRERWTDSQWGTNIKTVLPRGVSGDVYNLSDCILQQALVGSDANKLILSFLRHSLCSHLISHAAVLKTMSKFDRFEKPYCVIALLDFLDAIISGATCRNKAEESQLANASLSIVFWLSQIYIVIVDMHNLQSTIGREQQRILKILINVMDKIVSNQFILGIIYVGKHEDPELMLHIQQKYSDLKNASANCNFANAYQTQHFEECLKRIAYLDADGLANPNLDTTPETITYCLQPLISVEVLLKPNNGTKEYISQLLMLQRLKNYSLSRLYCELIRSCMASLANVSGVSGTNRESMWCAFTFIKVPQILKEMDHSHRGVASDDKIDYSPDVIAAFDHLLDDPILDFLDTKCGCNTIEALLVELEKHHLVNENHVKHFASRRESITDTLSRIEVNKSQPSIIELVKRAEHPLPGILKALESEYNKMQEALLKMLCQVLSGSGNSFDLILSVVTVEGKLKTFVSHLIRYNEGSKQLIGEPESAAKIRAALFDVSFLMLTFIIQTYGADVVLDKYGDSLFEKWVNDCMMDGNRHKSPMEMVHQCDQSKVDELLIYLNSTDNTFTSNSLKWQEICTNIPGVLYHLLLAWENETITATEVKIHLDNIKSKLCVYSVCAASWLCSYMQIVRDDELLKPMNMVQQFLTPLFSDEHLQQENMKERFGLTVQIIRKMQHDVYQSKKMRVLTNAQNIVSQNPLEEQFFSVWKSIDERGWLPFESTQILDNLLKSCGPFWVVSKMVNEVLQCKYSRDMNKTVDIVFAIMHVNIITCTISLLSEFLPMLLLNKMQKFELIEPQSTSLARLCVYCIISALELSLNATTKKRKLSDASDSNDFAGRIAKMRKLNPDETSNSSLADYPMQDDFSSPMTGLFTEQNTPVIREPLQTCLQNLFKMFAQFTVIDDLSPRICFIYQFLTMLQQCGKDRIAPALKLLPNGLIQNLLKVMANTDLAYDFILKIHDLNTPSGRNSAVSDLCLLRTIQLRKNSIIL